MLAGAAALLRWTPSAPPAGHAAARPAARMPVSPERLAPTTPPAPGPLGWSWLQLHPPPDLEVHAASGVLVDLDTREVMWARDPGSPRPPASLTKLVTAMVAADLATSLDQEVTVPAEATELESDSTFMGLSPGDVVTVRELLSGMFILSGNDAAETLARAFGDRDRFLRLMNEKAADLGMRGSRFANPTGLDDPGLRSTAEDLAVAGATIATRYPDLLALAGARDLLLPATAGHPAFFLHSLIKLVSTYPGATGLKTGYTDDAGYCLAGTATRGDRHLEVVLLGSDFSLTAEASRLLDYGFGVPRPQPLDPSTLRGL